MQDITDKEDIMLIVDTFYAKAKTDTLLAPIFNEAIDENEWNKHVERIYSFWNTVMFKKMDYLGNPFSHHKNLPIYKRHFDKWLEILEQVVFANYKGEKAQDMIERAHRMSQMFQLKLAANRSNPNSRPIL